MKIKDMKGELAISIDEKLVTITITTSLKELVDSLSPAQIQIAFDAIVLYRASVVQALERVLAGT